MGSGLYTDRGHRGLAKMLVDRVSHIAFGRGNWPDPMDPPVESFFATGLADEIGRAPVAAARYLVPDPAGTITFDGDVGIYRYATAPEIAAALPFAPSSDLEFVATLPANVAAGEVVCELSLVVDSTTSVPGWATPGQVTAAGYPFYLANVKGKAIEVDDEMTRRVRVTLKP